MNITFDQFKDLIDKRCFIMTDHYNTTLWEPSRVEKLKDSVTLFNGCTIYTVWRRKFNEQIPVDNGYMTLTLEDSKTINVSTDPYEPDYETTWTDTPGPTQLVWLYRAFDTEEIIRELLDKEP